MELKSLIKDIDLFLNSKQTFDTFLVKLETVEEEFLYLEKDLEERSFKLTEIILQSLDIIENIHIIIEEEDKKVYDELRLEQKKLVPLLGYVDEFLHCRDKIGENFILSDQKFESHPVMKSRLPAGEIERALPFQKKNFNFSEKPDEEELARSIISQIKEEELLTDNYILIKDTSLKFLNKEIDEKDFLKILDNLEEIICEAENEYELNYSPGVSAPESLIRDKYFKEGINDWLTALNSFYEYPVMNDEKYIYYGLKKACEGNRKLIVKQKMDEYIRVKSEE